jgi:nucleoside-diphosphate-sugar epimerase
MKILISGSNGIIGRQLIRDLYEFYPNAQFIELNRSISKLEVNPRIISLNINLLSAKDKELEDILNKYKPRLFFHLAWETSHGEYLNSSYNIEWCEN